jgi:hypothetical protein
MYILVHVSCPVGVISVLIFFRKLSRDVSDSHTRMTGDLGNKYGLSELLARTIFARSNTAIVGSNPTEAWMFVCVLCAFFLFLHSLK